MWVVKQNLTICYCFFYSLSLQKGSSHLTQKDIKTQFNKNRKQSVEEVIELKNDDSRDWWTKYFASVESAIIEVRIDRVRCIAFTLFVFMNVLGKSKNSLRGYQRVIADPNRTHTERC